ncbi:MAG: ABC transporter permease subunit [Kiritimatiellae bacterium]|nr:ABC transporter permease subunit [Kiritimatiellia bacterium]
MSLFSPEFKKRCQKFRRNRKSFFSLVFLLALFLLTLPAELLCNDKPLILRIDGEWFFPVFKTYTYSDMGGEHDAPILSYRSPLFKAFLAGESVAVDMAAIYRDEALTVEEPAIPRAAARKVWTLYPLVRHSYKSYYESEILPRQTLVCPASQVADGQRVPGAREEGHYLGTDKHGKDVLARLIYGFRLSLLFGLALALTSTLIGCILGAIQGYFGGIVDLLGQRATEIWGSIPQLMLMMMLSDFLSRQGHLSEGQHVMMLFLILNLTSWMGMAAHMRAMFLRARNLDYVKAAKSLGASNRRIMITHILPNSLTPIVTFLPFAVSGGIMALVGLDFLGFGLNYPTPSLGEMLAQGQDNIEAWWVIVPTFATLSTLLILLTFVGDGVRNAFDPRFK